MPSPLKLREEVQRAPQRASEPLSEKGTSGGGGIPAPLYAKAGLWTGGGTFSIYFRKLGESKNISMTSVSFDTAIYNKKIRPLANHTPSEVKPLNIIALTH
ncbi:MAG: hypothetical protein LBU32_00115 [Clostridiales bacterium]|nr:hypothetical protein [Clostridiales bacterium]